MKYVDFTNFHRFFFICFHDFFSTFQPVRFQLNHASAKFSGTQYTEREYSIWVSGKFRKKFEIF